MILLLITIAIGWWIFIPPILDALGYNAKPNMDVYECWVKLQLLRKKKHE